MTWQQHQDPATVARSCNTSQPTATRPCTESSTPKSIRARSSTTVLATDTASPRMRPASGDQPQYRASEYPSAVVAII